MLRDLVLKNRSYRRFKQDAPVSMETLRELVDLARHSASAANKQPLKYVLSCDAAKNEKIFDTLAWAAYLKDWPGPTEGERPSAYIVILHDTEAAANPGCDHGIAAQSILLGAVDKGLGGCMMGAIDRKHLREALRLPDRYDILLAIALGVPAETVVIETATDATGIRYWRDEAGVHHVPKRPLDELILGLD